MDWNNDGLHDMLVGDGEGHIHIFLNTGSNTAPVLDEGAIIQAGSADINVGMRAAPVSSDWNEDGRKDILIGNFDGNILVYLNVGTNASPVFNSSYLLQAGGADFDIGSRAAPRIVDWDHDGKKDILVGEFEGYVYFLKNEGTNKAPAFNAFEKLLLKSGEPLRYMPGDGPRSRLYVSDWNSDGLNDILVGGLDGRVMLFMAE